MHLKPFTYHRPASRAELWEAMETLPPADGVLIGGGTDVLVKMGQRLLAPAAVIGLRNVAEFHGIARMGNDVVIGAAVSLQHVRESALVCDFFPALVQAAAQVGSPQLRHMGTIGGNLCLDTRCLYYNQQDWPGAFPRCYKRGGTTCHVVPGGDRCYALFCADTPAALLALEARVSLTAPTGAREIPLDEFYRDDDGIRHRSIDAREVVEGIRIPVKPGVISTYFRFSTRAAIDFPLVGLAVAAEGSADGVFLNPRVAATGVGSRPLRLRQLEMLLAGRDRQRELADEELEDALRAVRPVRHQDVSPAYRKHLLRVLAKRAVRQISACNR